MEITPREFALLAGLIKEITGIDLDDSKRYFVESRMGPLLEKLGCGGYADFLAKAKSGAEAPIRDALIEAVTTHETSFFRDSRPFELLRTRLLPSLLAREGNRTVRIWSAACSTGQEAYSIAILCMELLGEKAASRVRILATDISRESLRIAEAGEYRDFEVQRGMPGERMERYLIKTAAGYAVRPCLRDLVRFQQDNILETGVPGPFDIILCRNVAIYFSPADCRRLYGHLADRLEPDGALVLGATESLIGLSNRFVRREEAGASYYRLPEGPAPA